MTRTTKDVFIKGIDVDTAKSIVTKWAAENNVKIVIDNPDYIYGRWGRGILTASKFFEITLVPTEGGVIAKTEGWIAYLPPSFWPDARTYVPETEFCESGFTYGGVPRKEGIEAIKRLWVALEGQSSAQH